MTTSKFERVALALLPTIVLAGILILRPHWGLMDDSTALYATVPGIETQGLLSYVLEYVRNDFVWGMFRPVYPLMTWLVYKPGMLFGAPVTFLWNALLSFLILWNAARVFARILGLRVSEILLVNGAVFYQYDIFQHPSLQEKLVLGTGAMFVEACWKARGLRGAAGVALWLLLGIGTKASFMIYFCVGFWAFLSAREKELWPPRRAWPWVSTGALAVAGAALLGFYAYISLHGYYTSGYFQNSPWPNLFSPMGAMFLFPVLAFLLAAFYTGAWKRDGIRIFLPAVAVLAFLGLFLRWGIGGYVEALIGTAYACLLLQCARLYLSRLPRAAWVVPVGFLALLVGSYRTYGSFVRLHDVGAILDEGPSLARAGVKLLWMPCFEGAQTMQVYFEHRPGNEMRVERALGKFDPQGKVFAYDSALCPFEGRGDAPPGCRAEMIWQGLWSRSFRIARMHCDR